MEKYKRFSDPATGINPFVPLGMNSSVVGSLLAPFCFFLGLVALFFIWALDTINNIARLSKILNPVYRFCTFFLCRGALFFWTLGWLRIHFYPPRPRGEVDKPAVPEPGEIIFANLQSPLDIYILQSIFPKYPLAFGFWSASSPSEKPTIDIRYSKMAAMSATLKCPQIAKETQFSTLQVDYAEAQGRAKQSGHVLVAFPEGATTNGRGVLKLPLLHCTGTSIHVASITFANPDHTCPVPSKSNLFHVLLGMTTRSIFSQTGNRTDVCLLRPSAAPQQTTIFSSEWTGSVQAKLCLAPLGIGARGERKVLGSSNAYEKLGFCDMWESHQSSK